jgi:hypothetical protein
MQLQLGISKVPAALKAAAQLQLQLLWPLRLMR